MFLQVLSRRVVYERKNLQSVDPLSTVELLDGQPVHDFTKNFTIEVKIAALQLKILHPL
jgi:hypothetical protein